MTPFANVAMSMLERAPLPMTVAGSLLVTVAAIARAIFAGSLA